MRALLLSLFLATPALAEVPTTPIAEDFKGIGYTLSSGGEVEVYAAVRDAGGKVAVCGLVIFAKAASSTKALERRFTERVGFTLAGKGLRVHTDSFKRYASLEEAQAAGTAGCAVTNKPWDPAYAKTKLEMALGNTTITY